MVLHRYFGQSLSSFDAVLESCRSWSHGVAAIRIDVLLVLHELDFEVDWEPDAVVVGVPWYYIHAVLGVEVPEYLQGNVQVFCYHFEVQILIYH